MVEVELEVAIQDAMSKAFSARHPKAQLAYLDLAEFFSKQLRRRYGEAYVSRTILTH
jgi:hypothetical protein